MALIINVYRPSIAFAHIGRKSGDSVRDIFKDAHLFDRIKTTGTV